jgi:hypothetical protein
MLVQKTHQHFWSLDTSSFSSSSRPFQNKEDLWKATHKMFGLHSVLLSHFNLIFSNLMNSACQGLLPFRVLLFWIVNQVCWGCNRSHVPLEGSMPLHYSKDDTPFYYNSTTTNHCYCPVVSSVLAGRWILRTFVWSGDNNGHDITFWCLFYEKKYDFDIDTVDQYVDGMLEKSWPFDNDHFWFLNMAQSH